MMSNLELQRRPGIHFRPMVGRHLVISPLIHELLPAMMPKPCLGQARWKIAYSALPSNSIGPLTSVPYVTRSLHDFSPSGGAITKSFVSAVASRWGCVGVVWLN